jgi:hypothetical protein
VAAAAAAGDVPLLSAAPLGEFHGGKFRVTARSGAAAAGRLFCRPLLLLGVFLLAVWVVFLLCQQWWK